ncbi:transcription factor Adf-1-like [Zootermopsis nevadensis]|uniref:Transcription factor Adf-1 n=1 Tax=Zootermopsis nevadensis TaxID=136037 RepID=A0A067RB37_ZOONE|nr:transcription factor Adf-1-like [Zootermopsis nevadensis]KDR16971.1 hypothetical protein L798_08913 [Zootermopsis nevadensis]
MDDEKLIELVRRNEVLYDMTHPKYMDPSFKKSIWNEIGKELSTTGTQCKSRWTNIRDHFRRNLRKRTTKSGQAAQNNKKYKYEDILQFILPNISEMQTISNVPSPGENLNFNQEQEEAVDRDLQDREQADTPHQSSGNTNSTSLQSRKYLKRNYAATESPSSLLMKYIINRNETARKDTEDSLDAFLMAIGVTMKKFSPYYQHVAKGRIFSVVQEIELRQLQNEHSYAPGSETTASRPHSADMTSSSVSSIPDNKSNI